MPDRRDASAVRIGGQEFDHVVYDHEADVLYLSVDKWLSDRSGEITVSMRVDANDLAPALA